nr:MAG TPA: hypothetical protein [Caudoviricetes sp.]
MPSCDLCPNWARKICQKATEAKFTTWRRSR